MKVDQPCHAVAVVGGACAGSVVAERLAEAGCRVAVIEQNPRPYGKIEDGLPRWHAKQRRMEYEKINARLDRPEVAYVPLTTLGTDIDFQELVSDWGFSAVVLANGAWKDRDLSHTEGADAALDHGLIYQNPFVYWFNHKNEASYDGPVYEVQPGALVIGGGLASIDVIKIIQLELYAKALAAKGVEADIHAMEHKGIPKYCAEHGIDDPSTLGVVPGKLFYRRRIEDMPLASLPANAPEKAKAKIAMVRQKILDKCVKKFLFDVHPQTVSQQFTLGADGNLAQVTFIKTEVEGRNAKPIPGSEFTIDATQVISSIGSIPAPIPGVNMKGAYYTYKDWDTGEYDGAEGVFGAGNVVTGQGNIKASLDHGKFVANHLIENYLGISADGSRDISAAGEIADGKGEATAEAVQAHLAKTPKLSPEQVAQVFERVEARQQAVDFDGDYPAWIAKVTPADME